MWVFFFLCKPNLDTELTTVEWILQLEFLFFFVMVFLLFTLGIVPLALWTLAQGRH